VGFKIVGTSTESTLNVEFTASGGGSFSMNADSTPVLTISFGGSVIQTISNATNPSTGTYVATWLPLVAGQYDLQWSFEVSGVPYVVDDTVFALEGASSAGTSGGFVTVDTTSDPFSASLVQGEFTYRSGSSPNMFQFTIVYEGASGQISVREIENGYGQIVSPYARIPRSVSDDISAAMLRVDNLLGLTSAINGTIVFDDDTEQSVMFSSPLANDSYRVQITSDVFAPFRISVKSRNGFTVEAGAKITGNVDFDVFI
jgi:hypothetical protein